MNCATPTRSTSPAPPLGNVPFTASEQAVKDLLIMRLGRQYAIALERICQLTGLSERDVKFAVQGLRLRHGYPVGSSRSKSPTGYYLISNVEELEDTVEPYHKQAITQLRVIRALMGPAKTRWQRFLGQLQLDLEREDTAA